MKEVAVVYQCHVNGIVTRFCREPEIGQRLCVTQFDIRIRRFGNLEIPALPGVLTRTMIVQREAYIKQRISPVLALYLEIFQKAVERIKLIGVSVQSRLAHPFEQSVEAIVTDHHISQ